MGRSTRRGGLALLTLLAGLTAAPFVPTAGAAEEPGTLEQIATCLRSRGRMLLVMMVDESGSLRTTDPANDRVTAARLALRNFASLTELPAEGGTTGIDVLVAGFSSGFETIAPWTALDGASLPGLEAAVEGFVGRATGIDTDFPTALLGAQRELARRSAEGGDEAGREPCKTVLLFTDGKYDIEEGGGAARREAGLEKEYAPGVSLDAPGSAAIVMAAGRAYLCDADGLADRLRGDGAIVVTLALAAQIEAADQEFLQALSSGEAGGQTCGTLRGPSFGTYLPAAQLEDLVSLFNEVAASIAGGAAVPGPDPEEVCAGAACARGRRSFEVDEVLRRFTVLADTGADGVTIELSPPGPGDPVVVEPAAGGSVEVAGAQLSWTWLSGRRMNLEADLPPGDTSWAGEWAVTFVARDPGVSARPTAEVFLYGGWSPQIVGEPELLRGERTAITIRLVDSADNEIDPRDYGGKVEVGAAVTDPTSRESTPLAVEGPDRNGHWRTAYVAPKSRETSVVDVDVRLQLTTPGGVALAPASRSTSLGVGTPDLYPEVSPAELRLSLARGTGGARGELTVTGGKHSTGCVWFDAPAFESFPAEAGALDTTLSPDAGARSECVKVAAGESRQVEVEVKPRSPGEGSARGTFGVHLEAVGTDEVLQVTLPVSFDLAPPINEARRFGLFVAILLPGVLVPIAVLWLLNIPLARFQPSAAVRVARVPVVVEETLTRAIRVFAEGQRAEAPVRRVTAAGALGPLALTEDDFEPLGIGTRRSRTLRWRDLELVAHAPRNPFGLPYGLVAGEAVCAAPEVTRSRSRAGKRVRLALPGTWLFVLRRDTVEPAAGDTGTWQLKLTEEALLHGELIVFAAEGDLEPQLQRLVPEIDELLPAIANDLAEGGGRVED